MSSLKAFKLVSFFALSDHKPVGICC